MPQSIENAPKDGTVILTDCGFARYLDQRQWASPVDHGKWAECDPFGNIYDDSDYGPSYCLPKLWMPVPDWIK